jgi:peptide/nickel transport system permease protein
MTWRRMRTGVALGLAALLVAAGPWFAPRAEDAVVGAPLQTSAPGAILGTDFLGRDVLSRTLDGGGELVLTATLAALGGTALGAVVGLVAAARGGIAGRLLERATEVLVVVPSVLVLLLLGTAVRDPSPLLLAAVLAVLATPWVARVVVAAAEPLLRTGYVEHAVASGERTWWIVTREVAPNMRATLLTLLGLRFVEAMYLVAGAAFLQVGPQPPEANWALMVRENAGGVLLNPWATVAPCVAIAAVAVTVTFACDRHRIREVLA